MADKISNLPVDDSPVIPEDAALINTYMMLDSKKEVVHQAFGTNKDILICTLIFFLFSLPSFDTLLGTVYPPAAENTFYRIVIKSLLFLIIIFIVNNLTYIRKPSNKS